MAGGWKQFLSTRVKEPHTRKKPWFPGRTTLKRLYLAINLILITILLVIFSLDFDNQETWKSGGDEKFKIIILRKVKLSKPEKQSFGTWTPEHEAITGTVNLLRNNQGKIENRKAAKKRKSSTKSTTLHQSKIHNPSINETSSGVQFDRNLPLLYPFAWNTRPEDGCPRISSGKNIFVIIVHTARANFLRRDAIRKTWGSVKSYQKWIVKLVFIIGEASTLEGANINLTSEYEKFGDISKSTFVDSYTNLTLKHAAGYSWILSNCPNATLVLKVDDDFVVDIFKVLKNKLSKLISYKDQGTIWCRRYQKKAPIRVPSSKWFVPVSLYSGKKFPDFCSGGAYLTTPPTIRKILNAAVQDNTKRIPMDDVFFTGIAVQEANRLAGKSKTPSKSNKPDVKHVDIGKEYFYYHWYAKKGMKAVRDWYGKPKSKSSPWTFFLIEHGDNFFEDFNYIWEKLCNFNSYKISQNSNTQQSNKIKSV